MEEQKIPLSQRCQICEKRWEVRYTSPLQCMRGQLCTSCFKWYVGFLSKPAAMKLEITNRLVVLPPLELLWDSMQALCQSVRERVQVPA